MSGMAGMLSPIVFAVPWALLAAVLFAIITQPEKVERVVGWFLRFFAWTGARVRRRSITLSLQGRINSFARAMNNEVDDGLPFNMRLEFVKELDRARFDPDSQTVIVRMRDRIDDDLNLVHAMLVFASVGVVPEVRPFLEMDMNDAIDITMTRKMLNSLKHHSGLQYLQKQVLPSATRSRPDIENYCRTFDMLDEHGTFTRVVLREFLDFGAAIESRFPDTHHAQEAKDFVRFVEEVAGRDPGQLMQTQFHGHHIATAFVLIGTGEKEGIQPYVNHLIWLRDRGYTRALVCARGDPQFDGLSIAVAEQVAVEAQRVGVAETEEKMRFTAAAKGGTTLSHILIRMKMIALPQPPEGSSSSRAKKPKLGDPPQPLRQGRR